MVRFGHGLDAVPYLAALGNKVVVGINHQQCGNLFF
jgi:hypothetical protein